MIVGHKDDIEFVRPEDPSVKGAEMKKIIGSEEGWEDHVMRIVRLEPNGYSFNHNHPWPHINYYIKGQGVLTIEGKEYPVKEGGYSLVPANKQHQWKSTEDSGLEFICIVPKEGHK
ncbi:MAG: cupin domain-containing protein [Dethiosulfatibacter sp.]|nr:cupin domain-containing protein [Dethiosulfatibacter sp.]